MGAWGTGPFENDDAMDWIDELQEHNSVDTLIVSITDMIQAEEYIEADAASQAIAAAQIVACLNGQPVSELPQDAQAWVKGKTRPSPQVLTDTKTVLEQVMENSELRELWQDSGIHDQWVSKTNECKIWLAPQS